MSGELDKGIALGNDISYQRKDVYGYCFETPAGALSEEVNGDSKYDNIFNIIKVYYYKSLRIYNILIPFFNFTI